MCSWLSDRTSHSHFHFSANFSLGVSMCVYLSNCVISLPHRAIIQSQRQRLVARSVIFDKLRWFPHFCCIWEPYTGILMDKGETGSGPFNHCTYSKSILQNYNKTAMKRTVLAKLVSAGIIWMDTAYWKYQTDKKAIKEHCKKNKNKKHKNCW